MNELQELLKDLKDIHEPTAVSIWPPAIGWWLLPIIIALLIFIIVWWWKRAQTPNYKKLALLDLKNIETNYQIQKNSKATAGEIALLIRKAMVAKYGNQKIAGMIESEWLAHLDNVSQTDLFTNGAGSAIVIAPYTKESSVDIENLFVATKKLLGRL